MPDGFLLDLDRCTGCAACRLGCSIENDLGPDRSWRQVQTFNEIRHPALPVHHLSLACHHCADAPCMRACPALAISRDAATGAVLIDAGRCIGCGYCAWACPYDAPLYDAAAGVMTKCTLCHPRLLQGEPPACVAACPTDALRFGDLEAAGGVEAVAGFPRTEAGPAIRFLGPRRGPAPPEGRRVDGADDAGLLADGGPAASKVGLRSEWPLVGFTLIAAALAAWMLAARLAPVALAPLPFLGAGLAGMALSTAHLGRPLRAWRAILNLRRSWLSREVALYGLFLAASAGSLLLAPESRALGWIAAATGLACLYCVDRVYDVARRPGSLRMHSAEALPTALFVAALLAGIGLAAALLGLLKGGLYVARKLGPGAAARGGAVRPGAATWVAVVRLGAGLLLPAVLWWAAPGAGRIWLLAAVALGELVDRCEYYDELEVPTPAAQAALDLRAALAAGRPAS